MDKYSVLKRLNDIQMDITQLMASVPNQAAMIPNMDTGGETKEIRPFDEMFGWDSYAPKDASYTPGDGKSFERMSNYLSNTDSSSKLKEIISVNMQKVAEAEKAAKKEAVKKVADGIKEMVARSKAPDPSDPASVKPIIDGMKALSQASKALALTPENADKVGKAAGNLQAKAAKELQAQMEYGANFIKNTSLGKIVNKAADAWSKKVESAVEQGRVDEFRFENAGAGTRRNMAQIFWDNGITNAANIARGGWFYSLSAPAAKMVNTLKSRGVPEKEATRMVWEAMARNIQKMADANGGDYVKAANAATDSNTRNLFNATVWTEVRFDDETIHYYTLFYKKAAEESKDVRQAAEKLQGEVPEKIESQFALDTAAFLNGDVSKAVNSMLKSNKFLGPQANALHKQYTAGIVELEKKAEALDPSLKEDAGKCIELLKATAQKLVQKRQAGFSQAAPYVILAGVVMVALAIFLFCAMTGIQSKLTMSKVKDAAGSIAKSPSAISGVMEWVAPIAKWGGLFIFGCMGIIFIGAGVVAMSDSNISQDNNEEGGFYEFIRRRSRDVFDYVVFPICNVFISE